MLWLRNQQLEVLGRYIHWLYCLPVASSIQHHAHSRKVASEEWQNSRSFEHVEHCLKVVQSWTNLFKKSVQDADCFSLDNFNSEKWESIFAISGVTFEWGLGDVLNDLCRNVGGVGYIVKKLGVECFELWNKVPIGHKLLERWLFVY